MIQPWSLPGSNITAIERPWTGIVVGHDGKTQLIYVDAVQRRDANEKLAKKANGGKLVASMSGWHEPRILCVA